MDCRYDKFKLTQTNTVLPRAYRLPKIHKKDVPLRPIISTINSPTHFLSKIIDNTLRYCFKNPASHIDNSFILKEKLADKFIPHDYILISLDVISLFTNIPLELVLRSLDKSFHKIQSSSKIPFVNIIDIVKFLFVTLIFFLTILFTSKFLVHPCALQFLPRLLI